MNDSVDRPPGEVRYLRNATRCRECGKRRDDGYTGEDFVLGGWICWDCINAI